jgi:competence protein ComEA
MRKAIRFSHKLAVGLYALLLFFAPILARAQTKPAPAKAVDLNTATVEQLQQLPAIGPVRAKAIVEFREKSGPFQRVEDLLAIRGISKSRFEKLRPYVTVTPPVKKPST